LEQEVSSPKTLTTPEAFEVPKTPTKEKRTLKIAIPGEKQAVPGIQPNSAGVVDNYPELPSVPSNTVGNVVETPRFHRKKRNTIFF
jgi:hypothetical protein